MSSAESDSSRSDKLSGSTTGRSDQDPPRTLSGRWLLRDWCIGKEKEGKRKTATDDAEITQAEDGTVTGRFRNDHGGEYEFSGLVSEEKIFTGQWRQTPFSNPVSLNVARFRSSRFRCRFGLRQGSRLESAVNPIEAADCLHSPLTPADRPIFRSGRKQCVFLTAYLAEPQRVRPFPSCFAALSCHFEAIF